MTLEVECPKGHRYIPVDSYKGWPRGAPYCPECFEEWEAEQAARRPPTLGIRVSDRVGTKESFG